MRILLLSTWFPFPLSQGSKIRAYHLIRSLAEENEVALVSFEDMIVQPELVEHMKRICKIVEVVPANPFVHNRLRTLKGWFSLQPGSVRASFSPEMASRIKRISAEWSPDAVIALTFVTAPYATAISGALKVVDVDNLMARMMHENFLQAKTSTAKVRSWLAWKKFFHYEENLYSKFDLCAVVSERDRREILNYVPIQPDQVIVVPNGADIDFYQTVYKNPEVNRLVYNGALTYKPNYDAIDYFLRYIFPLIREKVSDAKLIVTGGTNGVPINSLQINDHVTFTGYLKDIRQVVADSWACIVPLKTGGGTRIKILEAMALGTPVISTSKGAEGLDVESDHHLLIAETPGDFANQTIRLLSDQELRNKLALNAAQLVQEKYNWSKIGQYLNNELKKLFSSQHREV